MASTNLSQARPVNAAQQPSVKARLVAMTVAAFALRVFFILVFRTYAFSPIQNHYSFGFETGSIAASLATGHGFGSPFAVPTGPTTWIAPVYPAIVAAAFKVFGLFTNAAAISMLVFNSLCAALTVPFIYRIGRRVFDDRSAEVAGWIWALVPFFAYWPVTWVWETALSALLCAIVFNYTLELETTSWQAWAGLGVLWGAIALASPSLLGFFPASLLYPAWKIRKSSRTAISRILIAVMFFSAAVAPWIARNESVFHRLIFVRGNFWFEMSLSSFHTGNSEAWSGLHPAKNPRVLNQYIAQGEPGFFDAAKSRVISYVKKYPGEFAEQTATRVAHFWDGDELMYEQRSLVLQPWMVALTSALAFAGMILAAIRRNAWSLFAWLFVLFPIPYYMTSTNPRYRHPIEPMMVVLAGFFFTECGRWWTRRRNRAI
jgi:4-amino-4-deoxy-L-arabinose transferase-like glycosyltransferase